MKTSSVMMILMVDTAESSGRKRPRLVQGRHSIGAPSAMSMFKPLFKTVPVSIFLNKYAKKWTRVPSLMGDGGAARVSSKRAAVL